MYRGIGPFPSYIKAVFTGLITRIRAPSLLCGGSSVARVSVAFCGPGWPAYGSSSPQSTEGLPAQSSERGLLLFGPLLLLSVMTFVRRRIGVEGLAYPRGERGGDRERGIEEGETQRHVDRQECGLWKYELIFFSCALIE